MRDLPFLLIYRWIAVPLGLTFALLAFPFHKKIREGLKMRLYKKKDANWQKRPIWFHCASGEFEYAKPVISQIKKQNPHLPILVTYFSPSYKKQVENFPDVDMSCPLPLDLPGPVSSFLRHLEPRALLIARTDLWPELLYQCRKRKIPTLLFSARKSPSTLWQKLLWPWQKWLYANISEVFCVSDADAKNFSSFVDKDRLKTNGDTRYDQVFARLKQPKPVRDELFSSPMGVPILIAGSTWPEDERVLLEALSPLIQSRRLRLCLVPHEPTPQHVESLFGKILDLKMRPVRYSEAVSSESWDILIVDRVGILAELYQFADLAFVGGSFRKSVHSVMEPLACGLFTLVGPFHTNNREALEFMEVRLPSTPLTAVKAVQNASGLRSETEEFLKIKDRKPMKQFIALAVEKKKGASQKVVEWLFNHP